MVETVIAGSLMAILVGAVYCFVGWKVTVRRASPDAQFAIRAFAVWWYAIGTLGIVGGIQSLLAIGDLLTLPMAQTLLYVTLLGLDLALWGLLYYLLYLFTGSRKWLLPLTLFYIGYYFMLIYFVVSHNPIGVEVGRWRQEIVYERPVEQDLFTSLLILFLLIPQVLGALAYLTLVFRTRDPTQRYRILLVSLSIIVWFGSAYVASLLGGGTSDAWQIASRLIGLSAALAVLVAYRPPRWIVDKYGIKPFESDQSAAP